LAVNLPYVVVPIAVILSIWSYEVSVLQIVLEFMLATLIVVYIIVISKMSPCPPLLGHWLGPVLAVSSWVVSQAIYMRVRCLVAVRLEKFGQTTLITLGVMNTTGQIFGGLIIFFIINFSNIFVSTPDCVFDYSYCK
jgi:hypothetical protein